MYVSITKTKLKEFESLVVFSALNDSKAIHNKTQGCAHFLAHYAICRT